MSLRALQRRLEKLEDEWRAPRKGVMPRPFPHWLDDYVEQMGWTGGFDLDEPIDWKYDALPAQREFHADFETRFKGYSGPVGSGKSHALLMRHSC